MTTVETIHSAAPELRFAPDDSGTISGYASVWNKPDSFGDVLVRGAFGASLAAHKANGSRVLMLWSHDPSRPIGTWDSIIEDDIGLRVEGRLVLDSTGGRDAHALTKAGALDGLSIGFVTRKATATQTGRRVEAVDLIEISLVARPAQTAARVTSVRAADPTAAGFAALIHAAARRLKGS